MKNTSKRNKIVFNPNRKKLNIDFSVFLFVLYTIFILINDYVCLISNNKLSSISYILSFLIVILFYFLTKNKLKINKDNFNKVDIIFLLFFLIIFSLRVAIPDSSYDTLNYHLYLQENPFANNISYNFFPSRWINTFTLPLPDRMHYFFRMLLGYRLGIVLNFLCVIVIYYQIKKLLRYINNQVNETVISIFSIIILTTEQILSNMITYYVDLLVLPLFLEIIIVIFRKEQNHYNNYYLLLLAGLAISFKISNGFIILLLGLIYLIKYRKLITYKTFLIGIPIFIFPLAIYLINNYLQTGNPVFPFYNSIFKSAFLPTNNWMETFYGPKSLFERFLWPFYTLINTRRCYDNSIYYGRIAFGYGISLLIAIIDIFNMIKNKKKFDMLSKMAFLNISISLIWSNFMMGYIRYALILEVLGGIVSSAFIFKYFLANNFTFFLSIIAIFSLMYVAIFTCSDMFRSANELSWRLPITMDRDSYMNNLNKLFKKDYNYDLLLKDVSCIGITDYNSGYAILLGHDIPIINLSEGYANNYGKQKMQRVLNKCKNIYTISTDATYSRTSEYIEKIGYKQTGKINVGKAEFINYDNNLMLIEISK